MSNELLTQKLRALEDVLLSAEMFGLATDVSECIVLSEKEQETKKLPWISVKERLPEVGQHIIATDGTWAAQMMYGHYGHDARTLVMFRAPSGIGSGDDITYWMPMPAPPGTDANSEQGADTAVVEELVKAGDALADASERLTIACEGQMAVSPSLVLDELIAPRIHWDAAKAKLTNKK